MEIVQSYALRLQFADSGKDYITLKSEITIGRSSECDLPFPNSRVISRIHARIFYRDNAWYLVDTNSFNGTWLNKKRIEPNREYILNPGDELDFAHACVMIFLEGDAPDAMESAAVPVSPVWTAAPNKQLCHCCGSPVTGIFCSHCGSRIEEPQPTVLPNPANRPTQRKFCICCGMPASGMFCRYCGSRIDGTTPTPGFMDSSSSVPPVPMPAPSASMPAPLPQASMEPQPVHSVKKAQPKAAPKKPGLLSKVGALLGGKATPTTKTPAAPMPTPVTPDDVQFRGTAPKTINPGEYFPVKIMMYREDDYQRADRESANVADQVKSASSSVFQAKKGQKFRITLQSPDIDLDGESQQLCWNGKFAAADFEAFLPQEYDRSQVRIRGRVYSGDAVLTDLKLMKEHNINAIRTTGCALREGTAAKCVHLLCQCGSG